jgi:hypothetical protein
MVLVDVVFKFVKYKCEAIVFWVMYYDVKIFLHIVHYRVISLRH